LSVRELIENAGASLMFLPPYSRTNCAGLWYLIGILVDLFKPQVCANYFKSCGYDAE
jgi:hypothetical protein